MFSLTMSNKILFVCTGNTCRSPMCAVIARQKYGADADSRGLAADTSPMSENASLALAEAGYTPDTGRLSRQLTAEDLADADRIFTVTPAHAAVIRRAMPQFSDKITPLPLPIADPYGGDLPLYRLCLSDVEAALALLFEGGSDNGNH